MAEFFAQLQCGGFSLLTLSLCIDFIGVQSGVAKNPNTGVGNVDHSLCHGARDFAAVGQGENNFAVGDCGGHRSVVCHYSEHSVADRHDHRNAFAPVK